MKKLIAILSLGIVAVFAFGQATVKPKDPLVGSILWVNPKTGHPEWALPPDDGGQLTINEKTGRWEIVRNEIELDFDLTNLPPGSIQNGDIKTGRRIRESEQESGTGATCTPCTCKEPVKDSHLPIGDLDADLTALTDDTIGELPNFGEDIILARKVVTIHTNWTAFQKILPVCNDQNCKIEHQQIVKQSATITTNISFRIEYAGKTIDILADQKPFVGLPPERAVTEKYDLHGGAVGWRIAPQAIDLGVFQ